MATTTVLDARGGGIHAAPPRPKSPKLGDFSKIFDILLSSASKVAPVSTPAKPSSRPASPTPILCDTAYEGPKLFGGFDFSKLASPANSNVTDEGATATPDGSTAKRSRSLASAVGAYSTPRTTPPCSSEREVMGAASPARATQDSLRARLGTSSTSVDLDYTHTAWTAQLNKREDEQVRVARLHLTEKQRALYQKATTYQPVGQTPPALLSPGSGSVEFQPPNAFYSPWATPAPEKKRHDIIYPVYQVDKPVQMALLESALHEEYEDDMWLAQNVPGAPSQPIHIFVDLSNIIIGFYDCMKLRRGMPLNKRIKAPPFFFENFACLLERGRPVAKKIVAGSVVNAWGAWPEYMVEAEKCGYDMNILQRITKNARAPKRRTMGGNLADTTTSGGDSSDDAIVGTTKAPYPLKHGEQGVDELLHLKIAQSILDHPPSTMVLATGDAAEAEYSDGFLKNVERALERGWYVELVAWTKGISLAWRSKGFTQKWGDQFRVIELDNFAEELLAWYGQSSQERRQPFHSRVNA